MCAPNGKRFQFAVYSTLPSSGPLDERASLSSECSFSHDYRLSSLIQKGMGNGRKSKLHWEDTNAQFFFCSSYSRITLVCNGQETSRLLLEDMDRATEEGHGQKRELNFVVASIFITNSWSNYIFCMATTRRDAMVVDGEELMRQRQKVQCALELVLSCSAVLR